MLRNYCTTTVSHPCIATNYDTRYVRYIPGLLVRLRRPLRGWDGGGRTHELLALYIVIWPLATHPFRAGAPFSSSQVGGENDTISGERETDSDLDPDGYFVCLAFSCVLENLAELNTGVSSQKTSVDTNQERDASLPQTKKKT